MSSVTVITASLPTRAGMLAEAIGSVATQTWQPIEHLIGVDLERRGTGAVKRSLAMLARGDWVATLDDDDILHPDHLATLLDHSDDADIVWSWCSVIGREGWDPNAPGFDAEALRRQNYIPATALIRRDLVNRLGGWRNSRDLPHTFEDWDFWLRALDHGARFRLAPWRTWTYRFHPGSKTFSGEAGAL